MGFLERLEQKELQKETKTQIQLRKQQGRQRQPVRNLESAKGQEEKSKKYYDESGCSLLVDKLGGIIGGNVNVYEGKWEWGHATRTEYLIDQFGFNLQRNDQERFQMFTDRVFGYIKYKENGLGSWVVFLAWPGNRGESKGRSGWNENCIAIETCPSGAIYFHGGLFGSSIVEQNQWQKDKDCLEEALGKAYHHPKRKYHPVSATPPYSGFG